MKSLLVAISLVAFTMFIKQIRRGMKMITHQLEPRPFRLLAKIMIALNVLYFAVANLFTLNLFLPAIVLNGVVIIGTSVVVIFELLIHRFNPFTGEYL